MSSPDVKTRLTEATAVVEAVKVLDRYGFTTAARITAQAAEAILEFRVDHASRVDT
ncbi:MULTISPECIES: hypothetical protein [unclassified Mycobacterium]|uniref:hypothetical protein n=1 Tax=unclassified Mycobacterium TaxID=2642494 RepID=UPI0029C7DF68|nr:MULTISPECIES: hypothetical protein [unclassified Mycobacterium]